MAFRMENQKQSSTQESSQDVDDRGSSELRIAKQEVFRVEKGEIGVMQKKEESIGYYSAE